MYTKTEILKIAKAQLALDYNCKLSDFEKEKNTITENNLTKGRRIYDNDGCFLKILCFSGNAIISISPMFKDFCEEKILNKNAAWLFQYPKLRTIDEELQKYGHQIADIHHYYLPNPEVSKPQFVDNVKWYEANEILQFKNDDRFQEAFVFDENHPDVLAVAAMNRDNIMGIAGASADSKTMWQICIDVLPEYRGRGIGTKLVTLLKNEVLERGKVPFYGTVESHIHSQNIAVNSGFFPAWTELYSEKKMHC